MGYTKEQRLINSMSGSTKRMRNSNNNITDSFNIPNKSGDHMRSIKRDDPINDFDLVNKKYVDDTAAGYLELDGSNANQDIDIGSYDFSAGYISGTTGYFTGDLYTENFLDVYHYFIDSTGFFYDGSYYWSAVNDYFNFLDDIFMQSSEKIYFGTSSNNIGYDTTDGILEFTTDDYIRVQRNDSESNTQRAPFEVTHKTSQASLSDPFGTGIIFSIEDSSANSNIARIQANRNGADDTGILLAQVFNAGSKTTMQDWDASNDLSIFYSNVKMNSTKKLYFNDTSSYIYDDGTDLILESDGDVKVTTDLNVTGNIKISGTTLIDSSGFFKPKSSTDASAPNNSVYYSTTQSKLVYKDSGGTINNLY